MCLLLAPTASAAPPNDNFSSADALVGLSDSASGTNVEATKEAGEPNHANDPGGASIWYVWIAPSSGQFTINTCGSNFDTLLGVYTGLAVNSLTGVASNDQSAGPSCVLSDQSQVVFTATAGTTYRIAVDGSSDNGMTPADTGDVEIQLDQANPPPHDNFVNREALAGMVDQSSGTNRFATKEAGEPNHAGDPGGASVWYSWTAPSSGQFRIDTCASDFPTLLGVYTGGSVNALTPIAANAGACGGLSRVLFNATTGTAYAIAVDGSSLGGTLPAAAGDIELNLRPATPPANDNFAAAQPLSSGAIVNGNNVDAALEPGEPNHAGVPGGTSVWYRWTAPSSGLVRLDACAGTLDSLLGVYTGTDVGSLTQIASNDDLGGCGGGSGLTFYAIASTTYRIVIDGSAADEGIFRLVLSFSPAPGAQPVTDTKPPNARIAKVKLKKKKRRVRFTFAQLENGPGISWTFECKLDRKPFSPCTSPMTYGKLAPGKHAIRLRAIDQAGNIDPVPDVAKFNLPKRERS